MIEKKFDAALFDVDGTVLNTAEYIFRAYKYTIQLHLKREVVWEEVVPVLGLPLDECYRRLTSLKDVDHLTQSHNQFQYQNLHLAVAYPNALTTLRTLSNFGVSLGAVTTRYGDQLRQTLKLTGLDGYFQTIITPLDVKKPKPDPESLLKALKNLGIKPARAVMVGDTPVDISAGKNAGIQTIGALYGFFGQRLLKAEPDWAVENLEQIVPIILELQ